MTPLARLLTGATVEWDDVERSLRRRRRRRALAWATLPAAALAALVVARSRQPAPPAALALDDGRALPTGVLLDAPGVLRLSDRSRVATAARAELLVARHGPTTVEFTLRAGHASFEVTPGGPRRWRIDGGLAAVTVVGTGFDLDRDDARLVVTVRHGAVRVEGARVEGGARLLRDGASLVVWVTPPVAVAPPAPPPPPSVVVDAGVARPTPPAPPRRVAPPAPRAPVDASTPDVATVVARAEVDPAEALWQRADDARRADHHADAVTLLTTLVDEHPRSPRASMAAFLVGRDELRVLRRPAAAAEAYARALALGLPEGLREEAWLGLVDARWQSGDRAGARAAAAQYDRAYPVGVHRAYIDALVGTPP